jgi:hypothetical protein
MARIKYFNEETQQWEYADTVLGVKGDKGDSYVLTEADKVEIVQNILAQLPVYNGGVS